jgi:hypothetical protein
MDRMKTAKARTGITGEALAAVLLDRAAWTYARLHAGRSHNVELHEETITQDLLLDISSMFPDMSVQAFTKRQEARNGADWQWEWWFQGQRWFGLRVQAKRLKQRGKLRRPGYDFYYRSGSKGRRQVDLLIEDAESIGARAAYVLYNGPDLDISQFTWGCGRLPPSPDTFGVSLLPASVASDLADAKTVDLAAVGSRSRPWSCLTSCDPANGCHLTPLAEATAPAYVNYHSGDLAWSAARSYHRIALQASYTQQTDAVPDVSAGQRFIPGIRDSPPQYLARLLGGVSQADAELPPRVGALIVFLAPTISQ